jgi:hypothetical protein
LAFSGDNDVVDSILYDVNGSPLAVTSSQDVSFSQPLLLIAGLSGSTAKSIKVDAQGAFVVTGSVQVIPSSIQVITGTVGIGGPNVIATVRSASSPASSTDSALVVSLSPNSPVRLSDGNGKLIRATISQELKVAGLYTLADLTNKYELDTNVWDSLTTSGGTTTHVPTQSGLRCTVTGVSGSSASLCTNTYYKYQAGYTQLVTLSIIHADIGQTNQIREWGYFDDSNGLFFRLNGTALSIVERSSTSGVAVDTVISQSTWNVDKFDGTGTSGVTIDVSKGNLYEIEIQWFGVGTTRYFCNGILLHEVAHANTLTVPFMTTAQLPIAMRIRNSATSTTSNITLICARVAAQAQLHDPQEWVWSAFTSNDTLIGTTEKPVISIRAKNMFNSITNRSWILPRKLSISTEGYKLSYKIYVNATLTGSSYNSVASGSAAEYDVSATSFSGGDLIYRGFIDGAGHDNIDLSMFFKVMGRMIRNSGFAGSGVNSNDSLTIAAACEDVGRTRVRANIIWTEIK